jgi:dienelactone hydrolase
MRSRYWSSSVLALVLVAGGCGGHDAPDPFAYDRSAPLAERSSGVALSSARVVVRVISYAGADGARVNAFLLAPRSAGRHPAVLFLHGSGGNREDLLLPAAELASRGAVTMTISQPNDAQTFRPLVVNARRAFDLLAAQKDVDAHRLGVVGFSLGAQTAAILAGDDSRLSAVGIVSGRGSQTPLYWIRRAHEQLFFEAGTRDEVVPHAQLVSLIDAAPGHPRVRWYDSKHGMSRAAFEAMVAWQAAQLGLR